MKRPSKRRRRSLAVLAAGVLSWGVLALAGLAGLWTTLLILGAVIGLLVRNETSGRRQPGRTAPHALDAGPEEAAAGRRPSRPNAVTEDYNTLPASWNPSSPARRGRTAPGGRPVDEEEQPEEEQASRMPPPVPPPLFGRPGSRFLLAGDVPGEAAAEVAAAAARAPAADTAGAETVNADIPGTETVGIETAKTEIVSSQIVSTETVGVETLQEGLPEESPASETVQSGAAEPVPAEVETGAVEGVSTEAAGAESAEAPPAGAGPGDAGSAGAGTGDTGTKDTGTRDTGTTDAGTRTVAARPYQLPSLDMLPLPAVPRTITDDEILERASLLERTLRSFGVEARVVDFSLGPAVTRYELQPAPGVRVSKFTALVDDLALALAAEDVRIEAPIPGKSVIGVEVPNKERMPVPLREVLESPEFRGSSFRLPVAFGKDSAGNPVVGDLTRMPHLLIAGSTGSGKSVCMNSIICSLLFRARPDEVKMLMIDPKVVELSIYNGIPHLAAPVITDARRAAGYLKGAVKEMEARYELFAAAGVRNIEQYNQASAKPLPYMVIFIDELADLMMVAPADVEDSICRLAQMARACGIHLVIATQSPRVDVITGLIKANVPSRIAFAVSSQVDSRVILDCAGAERLLGRGDMLYHPSGLPKPVRAQGAFIDEEAVERLVRFVKAQGEPVYTAEEVEVETGPRRGGRSPAEEGAPASSLDAVLPLAARIVIEHGQASVSILQRRLRCNYTKATRLIDLLEERGFIGPHQGSKPREVRITMAQWQELFGKKEQG